MKNTFKLLAVMANLWLFQQLLPDSVAALAVTPLVAGLIGGGVGTLFGSLFGSKKPKTVTRDPEAEYEAMYKTQLKYADPLYEADKKYTPLYTDLELANQERSLFGTQGGQAGVLDMITRAQPQIDELTRMSTAYQREGDVADVEAMGGRATAAFRDAAGTTGILDQLRTQAEEEQGAEGILDPRLRREFAQSVRQGQAARGQGYGIGDISEEAAEGWQSSVP